MTIPSLPFTLTDIPAARRGKGEIAGCTEKKSYVTAAYFIFLSHLQVSCHH